MKRNIAKRILSDARHQTLSQDGIQEAMKIMIGKRMINHTPIELIKQQSKIIMNMAKHQTLNEDSIHRIFLILESKTKENHAKNNY